MTNETVPITRMEEVPRQPGIQADMQPQPESEPARSGSAGRLEGKVAIISGGDSGIGRAVAVLFAQEGADVAVIYLSEHADAHETQRMVEERGRKCIVMAGDIGQPKFCREAVEQTVRELGRVDIVVNNAAQQEEQSDFLKISPEQIERTFRTNIFGYFFLAQEALPHLAAGSTIINCTSVTAYRGSEHLIDYSSTKGAIVSFTRSLAKALAKDGIRVNGVAPGPVWTPLIPSTFPPEQLESFGKDVPLGRPGQPSEIAPCFLFLASDDSSYMTGQILHPNGGEVVNG